jgi:hypothetical protein
MTIYDCPGDFQGFSSGCAVCSAGLQTRQVFAVAVATALRTAGVSPALLLYVFAFHSRFQRPVARAQPQPVIPSEDAFSSIAQRELCVQALYGAIARVGVEGSVVAFACCLSPSI